MPDTWRREHGGQPSFGRLILAGLGMHSGTRHPLPLAGGRHVSHTPMDTVPNYRYRNASAMNGAIVGTSAQHLHGRRAAAYTCPEIHKTGINLDGSSQPRNDMEARRPNSLALAIRLDS